MAMNEDEFKFPDDKDQEDVKVELAEGGDIDIEVEDDTPIEDRNRAPLPQEMVQELEKDDLTEYSDKVKQRMSQLKKVWHDERREKEAAAREREEAVRYASSIIEENKRLKSTLTNGEEIYVRTLHNAASIELDQAKRNYREAYETGDTDKIIESQQAMNAAQMRLTEISNYRPQFKTPLQQQEIDVNIQPERPQAPKPDSKAVAWQKKNTWFGSDEEMTSLALGLHEKLVRNGIDPTSDDYYRRIDSTMRKRFPEQYEDATLDEDTPAQRTRPSTVVAPATRSTAPKKVRLNSTQLALSRKLGLTPEQYAREIIKLEKQNG